MAHAKLQHIMPIFFAGLPQHSTIDARPAEA
jgi:hypothetical protein